MSDNDEERITSEIDDVFEKDSRIANNNNLESVSSPTQGIRN